MQQTWGSRNQICDGCSRELFVRDGPTIMVVWHWPEGHDGRRRSIIVLDALWEFAWARDLLPFFYRLVVDSSGGHATW
jgi:hypothetical protein